MKKKLQRVLIVFVLLLAIPYIITVMLNGESMRVNQNGTLKYVKVKIGNVEKKVGFEEYFCGLLAKEMDVTYEIEALKAQAILLRTNIYRQIEENPNVVLTEDYMTYGEIEKVFGETKAEQVIKRLRDVFDETEGKTVLYQGKPIMASFHALSNGVTRNGKETLGSEAYPYLKSRECPKDIESKYQLQALTLTYPEVQEYCKAFLVALSKEETGKIFDFEDFEVKETDSGGYVTKIRIGKEIYPGEEFRRALRLPSGCFSLSDQEGSLKITTKGVGHGLGMSQYTANEMAKEGKTCEEILQYFFEGTEIKQVTEILSNIE